MAEHGPGGGLARDALRAASDDLVERVRALGDAVHVAGSGAVSAVAGPLPEAAGNLLGSLHALLQQSPAPTALLDVLMSEITAKRALLLALQEQLAALDDELAILQSALAPVQAWSSQWSHLQGAVVDSVLRRPAG